MDEDDLADWIEEQREDPGELARMMDPSEPPDHLEACVLVTHRYGGEWCCAPGCSAGRL